MKKSEPHLPPLNYNIPADSPSPKRPSEWEQAECRDGEGAPENLGGGEAP